jgi:hypothetical protein
VTKTTVTVNWKELRWVMYEADKAVTAPNKHRHNDNRKTKTRRHNKSVLFRRG